MDVPISKLMVTNYIWKLRIAHYKCGFGGCSNRGRFPVPPVNLMVMLTANGVVAQAFSLLVTTCYAKSLQETLAVLSVLERYSN